MNQPTPGERRDRRDAPSLVASFAFLAVTLGAIGLGYAVVAAPAVVAAFGAGALTAVVVTVVRTVHVERRDVRPFADRRSQ